MLVIGGAMLWSASAAAAEDVTINVANGGRSSSPAYQGPWVVVQIGKVPTPVLTVPVEYYKIPPGRMKKEGPPSGAGHRNGEKKPEDR
jgi:hypothetical protein